MHPPFGVVLQCFRPLLAGHLGPAPTSDCSSTAFFSAAAGARFAVALPHSLFPLCVRVCCVLSFPLCASSVPLCEPGL